MSNTTPDFVSQIWIGFKAEAVKLEAGALALAHTLGAAAVADFEEVVRIGAPLAAQAVIGQAANLVSGQEKFGGAVTSVMQQLEAAVGPVAIEDVQALVQLAFRSLPVIAAAL
ncbi:MAG TPA: hypothetical protein VGG69_01200 [Rhizomicrobium sp.]